MLQNKTFSEIFKHHAIEGSWLTIGEYLRNVLASIQALPSAHFLPPFQMRKRVSPRPRPVSSLIYVDLNEPYIQRNFCYLFPNAK